MAKKKRPASANAAPAARSAPSGRAQALEIQSEAWWRCLVENVPDIILVVDGEGSIRFVNRAPPGLQVKQVIGSNLLDFVSAEYRDGARG